MFFIGALCWNIGTANERELIFKEEVFKIVGAAMEVSNILGSGFLEAVYQEALEIELKEHNIPFIPQNCINIHYKNRLLEKKYIVDFLCFDKIVLEIKAIKKITEIEEAQLINYLKAAKLPMGLIINFGRPRKEWRKQHEKNKRNR